LGVVTTFIRKNGHWLLLVALLAAPLAWLAIPVIYSGFGVYNGARVQAARLGFHDQHIIKLRLWSCSTMFSSGVVVAYRKTDGDNEAQGRLCHEGSGWMWYPSTGDLSISVPLRK
jgi:predicted ABC-type sugar transport system permease subunit